MPDPITPNTLMTSLRGELDILNDVISECATTAVVFAIAPYTDGLVPDLIETTPTRGQAAIALSQSAYRNLSRSRDQHPSNTHRLPGVLQVDKSLVTAVTRINRLKTELKALISSIHPNARSRIAYCRKHFPGRVMLQVYRQLYCTDERVEKIRFTWEPITRSTRAVTRSAAINLLIKRQQQLIDGTPQHAACAITLSRIYKNPLNATYAIIKPRAPHPKITLYLSSGEHITAPANLPYIVPTHHAIDIGELPDKDTTTNQRQARSDKQRTALIYAPLYLHQVLP